VCSSSSQFGCSRIDRLSWVRASSDLLRLDSGNPLGCDGGDVLSYSDEKGLKVDGRWRLSQSRL
jgi:hypothetical protein